MNEVLKKDLHLSKRRLLDISVCAALLYAAVWIYELANYLSLLMVASQTSLVFSSIVPIGVSGSISGGSMLMLVKPAQIALATVAMLALFWMVRSMKLRLSSSVAMTMISVYLASAYWELLSSIGPLSYEVHLVIFSALAIGAQLGLSSRFKM